MNWMTVWCGFENGLLTTMHDPQQPAALVIVDLPHLHPLGHAEQSELTALAKADLNRHVAKYRANVACYGTSSRGSRG